MHTTIRCFVLTLVLALLAGPALAAGWPDLSTPPAAQGGGERDAALVVGIAHYDEMPDISGADDNARAWYAWLRDGRGVPAVKLLIDGEAAKEDIIEEAKAAAGRVQPGGTLWFVFIGHGAPAEGAEGVLVGEDAKATARSLYARSVTRQELSAALELGQQARTVMVLDACFSGKSASGEDLVSDLQPGLLTGSYRPPRATVLTAARGDQFAGGLPGTLRPAFSYLLLGALRGWGDGDDDGQVTAAEAVDYADRALYEVVKGRSQNPELLGEGRDLVLSSGRERGPDLAAIVLDLGRSSSLGGGQLERGVAFDRGDHIVNTVTDQTGFLVVKATPADATIFINGREVGRGAVQIEEMVGQYVVVAEAGLYHPARQEIRLGTDGARLELSLSPAFGLLQVSSTPAGAEVRLDGERVGTTPWKVERKKSGSYELSLALDDYLGHRETIEVRDGQPTSVSATLEPNFGGLVVHSSPAGARVLLDGRDSGELTPATFSIVKPGVTEVRLTLEGYGDVVKAATVERRGTARLDLTLPPKLGLLSVMANGRDGAPCEGAVFLDGQQRGLTPLKLELPAREYALEVRCGKSVGKERVAVLHNERVSLTVDTGGVGDLDWVSIPGGSFSMGSSDGGSDEKPVHTVRVASFEMARSEVTFGQYQACVDAGACTAPHVSDGTCRVKLDGKWQNGRLPSSFQGAEQPVVCVDWEQARAYARWVGGRLPTEAEWEYAARGGQSYTHAGSNTAGDVAWYDGNSGGRTQEVCGKRQNGYGLCDMSGNVWEWVEDWYHSSYTGAPTDGSAWLSPSGSDRVIRGGSWNYSARIARVANRNYDDPGLRSGNLGLRLVRE